MLEVHPCCKGVGPGVTGQLAAGRVTESRHTVPVGVAALLAQDINSDFCHELLGLKDSTQLPGTSRDPAQLPVQVLLQHRSL